MKMRAELGTILAAVACCAASAADLGMHRNDEWRSVPVDRVRLNGPLGRRVALTATNNLMKIDLEGAFFKPFREKKATDGFIGLGTLTLRGNQAHRPVKVRAPGGIRVSGDTPFEKK